MTPRAIKNRAERERVFSIAGILHGARGARQTVRTYNKGEQLTDDLYGVVFNHRVGEKLLAHPFEFRLGGNGIGGGKFQIEHLALSDRFHAGKSQSFEGAFDGLTLGVEHTVLQGDDDAGFHDAVRVSFLGGGARENEKLLNETRAGGEGIIRLNQNAEPLGDFAIGIDKAAKALAEP